ncbi:MAG: prenyltransferase/squalene oxidase repeat-containing protein [Planctomycetota bacterium]
MKAGPWAVLGPFDCPKADVRLETEVEKLLKRMQGGEAGPDLTLTFAGRGKAKLAWRWLGAAELPKPAVASPFESGVLDLGVLTGVTGPASDNAAVYLYREFVADQGVAVELSCGSDDALRLWLNGELLVESTRPRGLKLLDEPFTLRLVPGRNHLLVKVANVGGAFAFGMTEPRPVGSQDINAAIDRGVDWLLARQLYDGSWASHQDGYASGQTALTLYTLLKSGVSARHSAVQPALVQLETRPPDRTYSLACTIFALAALHDPAHRRWMAELVEQLLDEQHADGGWSYPGEQTDLSNSQYAALALRAAALEGVEVPTKVWTELVDFGLLHREDSREKEAGFIYAPRHDTGYTGSMTTAGIGLLAICRAALGEGMPAQLKQAATSAIEAGVAWLEKRWSVSRNPNKDDWHLYYLYGIERVGALLGRDRLGSHDWYAEGSRYLVRAQEPGGDWAGSETDTCFALLFLARATAPQSGGPRDARIFASAREPVCVRVRLGTPTTLWIDPPVLTAGRALARVEFFVRRVGLDWELVGPGDQALALSYAFAEPGAYEVRAEAELTDGERLLSDTLVVTYQEGLSAAQRAAASDALRNRLAFMAPRAHASSAVEPAANAVDNKSWTRWVCEPTDADPWIEIELGKSLQAARLILAHARTSRADSEGPNPRPTRVELWLQNEKTPRVVELDDGARA